MKTVSIRIDDSLFSSIVASAEVDGATVSDVMRRALENEISGGIQQQILQLQIVTLGTLLTMPELDKKGAHNAIEHVAKNLDTFTALAVISDEEDTE